ncbi:hypothetical protein [Streptomyces sp. NPDC052179]|uniref:hypothetical protein n=1 Tax=Streptomyces sp. NPDC052179 TaxID=3155680 RepID=UPI003414B652
MIARLIGFEVSCDGPTAEDDCPDCADGRKDGWTTSPAASGRLLDHCPTCTHTRKGNR